MSAALRLRLRGAARRVAAALAASICVPVAWPVAALVALPPAHAQTASPKAEATRIVSAEAGLFAPPGNEAHLFQAGASLPLRDGQAFGWRMTLKTPKKKVLVREELTAPAEPKTWGDPEPDLKRMTTPDGRTVITEVWMDVRDGVIFHSWTVTLGDPAGAWVFKVFVDGLPERVMRLQAR